MSSNPANPLRPAVTALKKRYTELSLSLSFSFSGRPECPDGSSFCAMEQLLLAQIAGRSLFFVGFTYGVSRDYPETLLSDVTNPLTNLARQSSPP